jgi:hypothetical protein
MMTTGKSRTWIKTRTSDTLSPTNPVWTGMGLNMGLHGNRQANNCPKHGTSYLQNVFGEKMISREL